MRKHGEEKIRGQMRNSRNIFGLGMATIVGIATGFKYNK